MYVVYKFCVDTEEARWVSFNFMNNFWAVFGSRLVAFWWLQYGYNQDNLASLQKKSQKTLFPGKSIAVTLLGPILNDHSLRHPGCRFHSNRASFWLNSGSEHYNFRILIETSLQSTWNLQSTPKRHLDQYPNHRTSNHRSGISSDHAVQNLKVLNKLSKKFVTFIVTSLILLSFTVLCSELFRQKLFIVILPVCLVDLLQQIWLEKDMRSLWK